MFGGRRKKKKETETDEDEEIDPYLRALQKSLVEKTPLAVESSEHFDEDDSLLLCKRCKLIILNNNLCMLIWILHYLFVKQMFCTTKL